jgi:hypothetical protein
LPFKCNLQRYTKANAAQQTQIDNLGSGSCGRDCRLRLLSAAPVSAITLGSDYFDLSRGDGATAVGVAAAASDALSQYVGEWVGDGSCGDNAAVNKLLNDAVEAQALMVHAYNDLTCQYCNAADCDDLSDPKTCSDTTLPSCDCSAATEPVFAANAALNQFHDAFDSAMPACNTGTDLKNLNTLWNSPVVTTQNAFTDAFHDLICQYCDRVTCEFSLKCSGTVPVCSCSK